jgi:hypothetical protein
MMHEAMAPKRMWAVVGAGALLAAAALYVLLRGGPGGETVAPSTPVASTGRPARAASDAQAAAFEPTDADDDEIALLARARAHAADPDPSECLAALDAYDVRFPSGALRPEAIVLRVDVLLRADKPDRAQTWAKRLYAGWPGSSHADTVREMIEADRQRRESIP